MSESISVAGVESFYRAALVGLGWLDAVEAKQRRFGPEADARWKGFAGHLTPTDRIDILLRDAAVVWGTAFAPASAFRLPGLATDESFGPDWSGVHVDVARKLWKEAEGAELSSWESAWSRALEAWGTSVGREQVDLGELTPATRLLVAGPSALDACVREFARREELSWNDQVVVVADAPGQRHLAGIAGLVVRKRAVTRLVAPSAASAAQPPAELVRQAGLTSIDRVVVSDDADSTDRNFAAAAGDVRAS